MTTTTYPNPNRPLDTTNNIHYISNNNARTYVERRLAFNGSPNPNVFAKTTLNPRCSALYGGWITTMTPDHHLYVVYSYGDHWPLFIYDPDTDQWFENADKYGSTTSKHASQARPYRLTANTTTTNPNPIIKLNSRDMVALSLSGYRHFMAHRLTHGTGVQSHV